MSDLKPCPFCGACECREEIQNVGGIVFHWHILQHEPWCFLYHLKGEQGITESDVKAWNTRAERTCRMDVFAVHDDGTITYQCSECGQGYCVDDMPPNYCPDCGAKVVEN